MVAVRNRVTPAQAYQVALSGLRRVWAAVSSAADSWAANPSMQLRIVSAPIQIVVRDAVGDITPIATQFGEDEPVRLILDEIVDKLQTFASQIMVPQARRPIVMARELVGAWNVTLRTMLTSIAQKDPGVIELKPYQNLISDLARAA